MLLLVLILVLVLMLRAATRLQLGQSACVEVHFQNKRYGRTHYYYFGRSLFLRDFILKLTNIPHCFCASLPFAPLF